MKSAKVFISYSAEKKAGQITEAGHKLIVLRDKIDRALEAGGHHVKFDQKNLTLGMQWRHEINVWLSTCQVAILLLDSAALKSTYVAYEIGNLYLRREMSKNQLLIIPVFLDGIGSQQLKRSLLKAIPLEEVQGVTGKVDDSEEQLIEKVIAIIAKTSIPRCDYNDNVRYIAGEVFQNLSDVVMERAAEEVKITTASWLPDEHLKEKVAYALFSGGITAKTKPCMGYLIKRLSVDSKNKAEDLVGLVASSWVGETCTTNIKNNWKNKLFFLNNGNANLPQFYLFSIDPPMDSWTLIPVIPSVTDDFLDSVVVAIWQNLMKRLRETDKDRLLDSIAEGFDEYKSPICISLVLDVLTEEIVDKLKNIFPKVVFFFVVKQVREYNQSWQEELVHLTPFLSEKEENVLCNDYEKLKARMLREEY